MFIPWFTPLSTKSGRCGRSACTASITQSVGVPVTECVRSPTERARTGTCMVSEWLVALCSRSGATTCTSPSGWAASESTRSPRARYPSSLVQRISIYPAWCGATVCARPRRPPSPEIADGTACPRFPTLPTRGRVGAALGSTRAFRPGVTSSLPAKRDVARDHVEVHDADHAVGARDRAREHQPVAVLEVVGVDAHLAAVALPVYVDVRRPGAACDPRRAVEPAPVVVQVQV